MSWNKYDSVLSKLFRHVERQNFVHIVQIGLSFNIVSLIILNLCVSTARKTMDPDQSKLFSIEYKSSCFKKCLYMVSYKVLNVLSITKSKIFFEHGHFLVSTHLLYSYNFLMSWPNTLWYPTHSSPHKAVHENSLSVTRAFPAWTPNVWESSKLKLIVDIFI